MASCRIARSRSLLCSEVSSIAELAMKKTKDEVCSCNPNSVKLINTSACNDKEAAQHHQESQYITWYGGTLHVENLKT